MSYDYKKGDIVIHRDGYNKFTVVGIDLVNPHINDTFHFVTFNKKHYGTHVSNIMRLATEREVFFFHIWGPYNLEELKKELE